MTECLSCQRIRERDNGEARDWDCIYRSEFWDLAHAYNTSYLGWLVLIARRHIEALDELSVAEAAELGSLLREVSLALKRQTGCRKTYVMQFAESREHPHAHFHIVPRQPDQAPDDIAYKVMRHLGVPLRERCDEQEMNALALAIRQQLSSIRE